MFAARQRAVEILGKWIDHVLRELSVRLKSEQKFRRPELADQGIPPTVDHIVLELGWSELGEKLVDLRLSYGKAGSFAEKLKISGQVVEVAENYTVPRIEGCRAGLCPSMVSSSGGSQLVMDQTLRGSSAR